MKKLAAPLLLVMALGAAALAATRVERLAANGVRITLPVFYTPASLHATPTLNPDHKELLEFLFRKFPKEKTGVDPFAGARTCAIVGNSGNLTGSRQGAEIDAHDAILRMNEAPTAGYETDVGSRTTIVLTNANKMPTIVSGDVHFITYCDQIPETLNTINKFLSRKTLFGFKSINVLDNAFFFSLKPYSKSKPSTGLAAVAMALAGCEEVDLYGFGKDARGEWDHYFPSEKWNPGNAFHSVSNEEEFLASLERKKLIRIHRGQR